MCVWVTLLLLKLSWGPSSVTQLTRLIFWLKEEVRHSCHNRQKKIFQKQNIKMKEGQTWFVRNTQKAEPRLHKEE